MSSGLGPLASSWALMTGVFQRSLTSFPPVPPPAPLGGQSLPGPFPGGLVCLLQSVLTRGPQSHSFQSHNKYLLGKHNPANDTVGDADTMSQHPPSTSPAPGAWPTNSFTLTTLRAGVLTPFHR